MAIIASIISTFDPRGLNNAKKSFSALTDSNVSGAKKQQIAMKLLGGAFATAGVAAGAFAAKLGVDAVRAAIADEKSVANLNRTLKNLGQGFQQTQIEDFVTQMQFATGVSDSALRPAMNQLLLSTNDVAKSQRMLELALNISASTGKDLEAVTIALSKASMGNFTALTRLGVPLDKTIIKNKDLEATLSSLETQFQGASAAAASTMGGQLSILTERIGEAQEAVGYDLILALQLASNEMDGVGGVADSITNMGDRLGDFIVGLGYYIGQIDVSTEETSRFNQALEKTGQTILLSLLGPLYTAIPALGDLFGFVAEKGDELKITNENNALTAELAGARYLELAKSLGYVTNSTEEVIDVEKEEAEALKAAEKAAKEKEKALQDLQKAQERIKKTSQDFASFVAGTNPKTIQGSLDAAKVAVDDMRKEFNGIRSVTEQTADRFSDLSGVVKDELGSAFSSAEDQLQSAKEAFNEFRDAISGSITGTIDFASAIEDQDFVTGLEEQANTAIKFSEKVGKLLELGLSERALREVLETGAETGTAIADQIIAGGSTVVQKVNTLVASVDNVASIVGQKGAEVFYSAGVAQGQALVDGIKQTILSAAAEIAALASSLGSVTIVPPVTTTLVTDPKPPQDIKKPTPTELTRTEKIVKAAGGAQSTAASRSYTAMAAAMGRIRLADGGIVMGPTNALIGEAGPEAVIPLSGTNSVKMGTTYNITVNAGMGTNGAQVGREIVDAIKKFERTSGPVFASA
jgi:ElaB/YqjD/DUF883 family membrane-anchored ribosome-binding protein